MLTDIIAGTSGGIAVVLIGHPFDTTKTRLQTAPSNFYKGTLDCVKKTIHWEGFSGFYAGIYSPLAGQMFFRACSFTTNIWTKKFFNVQNTKDNFNFQKNFLCGVLTGFTISFIESPIDFIKTKLQVQIIKSKMDPSSEIKYNSVTSCAKYYMKNYSKFSIYQGFSGTLIRNLPANGLFFSVNDYVKYHFAKKQNKDPKYLDIKYNMIAGSLAGLSYWIGTYPLDIIKSRMQCMDPNMKINWYQTCLSIYRSGGLRAFTVGLLPCTLRSIPACACMFATVDFVRARLG